MAAKLFFVCSGCGYKSSKWLGKCPECSSWNSFVEEVELPSPKQHAKNSPKGSISPVSIETVSLEDKERLYTRIFEFDRVLGGIVPGQAILLSGEPGIGKSTLILSIAGRLADQKKIYYINGEESNTQVKIRAERTGAVSQNLFLFSENEISAVEARIKTDKPAALFVDSIQTVFSSDYSSLAGSIVQIRESSYRLIQMCKELNIPLFLIGHITKTGNIAGPKVVEHMVDTVLFFEADNRGYYRILRSLKNRFYSTDEIGFFTMEETGLKEIEDASNAFTAIHEESVSGISIFPLLEGNRVFPVEIQALCSPSQFNYPKRTADGMDINRLYMLIAIMEKALKINLSAHDIYLNITNGLKISDPSLDLAVIFAIYSSFKDLPSPLDTAVFGEVGLTGEVRPVLKPEKRAQEMSRLGLARIVLPFQSSGNIPSLEKARVLPVKNILEGIQVIF